MIILSTFFRQYFKYYTCSQTFHRQTVQKEPSHHDDDGCPLSGVSLVRCQRYVRRTWRLCFPTIHKVANVDILYCDMLDIFTSHINFNSKHHDDSKSVLIQIESCTTKPNLPTLCIAGKLEWVPLTATALILSNGCCRNWTGPASIRCFNLTHNGLPNLPCTKPS